MAPETAQIADDPNIDWFAAASAQDTPQLSPIPTASGTQETPTNEQPTDWWKLAAGIEDTTPAKVAEPAKEGWGEWLVNSVRGRQDPNEANTGTVFEQFPNDLRGPTGLAAITGTNDEGMADVIERNLGDRFVRREKDANGYDILVTRDPTGEEQRGYVNRPGLDTQDVARGIYGALPYIGVGGGIGALGRGLGWGAQGLLQGGGAGLTSVVGDIGATLQGSKQGIDISKAALNAGLAGVAPGVGAAASALWRKFVTIPGLIDKSTGQLTPKGISAAREAGVDPADITPDFSRSFAQSMAKTGDAAQAATQAHTDRYGITPTRGQATKDPYHLTQEEQMRRGLYGSQAKKTIQDFDKEQEAAIRYAALGADDDLVPRLPGSGPAPGQSGVFRPAQGIGEQLNPGRQPGSTTFGAIDRMPGTLGANVQDTLQAARQSAKRQETSLWDASVRDLAATPAALQNLRPHVGAALAKETAFTPTGERMAQAIGQFAEGELPITSAGGIQLNPVQTVDQMRRRLGSLMETASDNADRRQAGMIYDAFNDWIGESAKNSLLAGDPAAAMQLVKARGFTKEVRDLFAPKLADGTKSPAAQSIGKILDPGKADSGEGVIDALFGSHGSRGVNQGTVSTLRNVKAAFDRFATPEAATQAWNDIRLAHWARLVTDRTGAPLGPTAILRNINGAMQSQSTLMNSLYTPSEQMQMRSFVKALRAVTYKPPNASGSGYTTGLVIQDWLARLADGLGIGAPARLAAKWTGLAGAAENALGASAVKQAIGKIARPKRINPVPTAASVSQAIATNPPLPRLKRRITPQ